MLGFEVEGVDEHLSALDTSAYKRMVEKVVKTYPNVKVVGTTLREVKSGLINNWSAILWHEGTFYESRVFKDLEIEARVGGGDGFASGFAYGFLNNKSPQECVNLGVAHGAITLNGKLWDIAAPAAIVVEAGGIVTNPRGQPIFPFDLTGYTGGKVPYLMAGPAAHPELLSDMLR